MATAQATIPKILAPMLATSSEPFDDATFLFDIKWDGVRAMAAKRNGLWSFWGRSLQDYTPRYPDLAAALASLPDGTILDGELVAMHDGRPDFHALMVEHRGRVGKRGTAREPVAYVVFDMPYYDGASLVRVPLSERRQVLKAAMADAQPPVFSCDGTVGNGIATFRRAIDLGHEGIVAKRLNSAYTPGKRSEAWRKIKPSVDIPCVVVGYRLSGGGLRDLLLATMSDRGLQFCGAVELGLGGSKQLLARLASHQRRTPMIPCSMRACWVDGGLFCVIRCQGFRPNGVWRDPVFYGWADDSILGPATQKT